MSRPVERAAVAASVPVPLADQLVEAELHAQGLHDYVARFSGNKRWPAHEVERKRQRATVADALVDTLRGLVDEQAARRSA